MKLPSQKLRGYDQYFILPDDRDAGDCSSQHNHFTQKYKLSNSCTKKNPEMNQIEDCLEESFYNVKYGSLIIKSKVTQKISVMKT